MNQDRQASTNTLITVDDLSAPTILVDSFAGIISINGVHIFGCTQAVLQVSSDTEMTPQKKVVLRLAIPTGSLPAIARLFKEQVDQLVASGHIQVEDQNA